MDGTNPNLTTNKWIQKVSSKIWSCEKNNPCYSSFAFGTSTHKTNNSKNKPLKLLTLQHLLYYYYPLYMSEYNMRNMAYHGRLWYAIMFCISIRISIKNISLKIFLRFPKKPDIEIQEHVPVYCTNKY